VAFSRSDASKIRLLQDQPRYGARTRTLATGSASTSTFRRRCRWATRSRNCEKFCRLAAIATITPPAAARTARHAAEQQRRFRRRVRAHAPHAHADERPPQSDGSTAHLASVSAMSRRAATNTSISPSPTRRRDTLCRRRPRHCRDVAEKIEQAHAVAALEHVLAVDQLHEAAGSREVVRLHFHHAERSCGIALVCRHGPDTSNGTGRERIEVPARVRRRIACVIITGARA